MVVIPYRNGIKIHFAENVEQAVLRAVGARLCHIIPHPINSETVRLLGNYSVHYPTMHHDTER